MVPLVVNLYMFGAKDFDVKKALYYMLKAASDGGVGGTATWSGRESPRTWSTATRRRPRSFAAIMGSTVRRSRWSGRSTTSPSRD
ncbi:alpha-1,2-mannosidase family domain protein [Mycobacterium xenopi 4042]|uniref:Alpha-1,2-mannosidase family domain protein n=1 Tax=Mycobacterium xenopi 4042 TaxID=1299334 RepID=X8C8B2_MYCXE|nr:alpha-1,2-mannosidase family domain protein [Mycobacterium xenopi 4042]